MKMATRRIPNHKKRKVGEGQGRRARSDVERAPKSRPQPVGRQRSQKPQRKPHDTRSTADSHSRTTSPYQSDPAIFKYPSYYLQDYQPHRLRSPDHVQQYQPRHGQYQTDHAQEHRHQSRNYTPYHRQAQNYQPRSRDHHQAQSRSQTPYHYPVQDYRPRRDRNPRTADPSSPPQAGFSSPTYPPPPYDHVHHFSPSPLSTCYSPSTTSTYQVDNLHQAHIHGRSGHFAPSPLSEYHSYGRPPQTEPGDAPMLIPPPRGPSLRILAPQPTRGRRAPDIIVTPPESAPQPAHPTLPLLDMSEEQLSNFWSPWNGTELDDVLANPIERYGSAVRQQRSIFDGSDMSPQEAGVYVESHHQEIPTLRPTSGYRPLPKKSKPLKRKPVAKRRPAQDIEFGKPIYVYREQGGNFLARFVSDLEEISGPVEFRVVEHDDDQTARDLEAGKRVTVKAMSKLGELKVMAVERILEYVNRTHPAELVEPHKPKGPPPTRKTLNPATPSVDELVTYGVPYRSDTSGYYHL
ncbi:hypothetical protein B0T21DRAFT_378325 [Apiosordaria backusii]|uniref:Uncharacterized protein n=1 Tax=Apiosordaria backusii TaxID=314023 RepID=A0AA39ZRZ9_9PEZI|nr:hypothetical protein B0T21DRAFT_378325 [Apiosordaria backusii]